MKAATIRLLSILLAGSLCGCAGQAAKLLPPQQHSRDNWLNPAHCTGAGGDCGIR
jgi:hypothetical protein